MNRKNNIQHKNWGFSSDHFTQHIQLDSAVRGAYNVWSWTTVAWDKRFEAQHGPVSIKPTVGVLGDSTEWKTSSRAFKIIIVSDIVFYCAAERAVIHRMSIFECKEVQLKWIEMYKKKKWMIVDSFVWKFWKKKSVKWQSWIFLNASYMK